MEILPSRADQPRVEGWIFVVTWLFGGVALMMGLNGGGAGQTAFALVFFLVVCGLWLWAVKLSRGKGVGGLLVIAYWLLGPAGALLTDFHHFIKDLFFLILTATILCLILAFVMLHRRSELLRSDGVI